MTRSTRRETSTVRRTIRRWRAPLLGGFVVSVGLALGQGFGVWGAYADIWPNPLAPTVSGDLGIADSIDAGLAVAAAPLPFNPQ